MEQNDAEEAFKIDSDGENSPLVYESLVSDNIFQDGEEWSFILQDHRSLVPLDGSTMFNSLGIAGESEISSFEGLLSTGSIIADQVPLTTPVPTAVWLFVSGLLCLIGVRRSKK